MKYVIDTNILITAWNNTYPFDTFKSLWEWLKRKMVSGEIIICDSVYNEIKSFKDDLWNWLDGVIKNNSINIENKSNTEIINSYSIVINEANRNPNYTSSALTVFGGNADGWIIAHALANNYVLVTEEKSSLGSKKSVKIPDICFSLGVKVTNTIGMLQALSFKM